MRVPFCPILCDSDCNINFNVSQGCQEQFLNIIIVTIQVRTSIPIIEITIRASYPDLQIRGYILFFINFFNTKLYEKNSAICVRTRTINVNTFSDTVKDEISEGRQIPAQRGRGGSHYSNNFVCCNVAVICHYVGVEVICHSTFRSGYQF